MEQNNAFKSRLLGFDKKMVLDYILQFNQQVQQNEQQLVSRINELDGLRRQLEEQMVDRDTRLADLITKNNELKQSAADNQAMAQKLGEESARLRSLIEEKDREIQIQNERCRQLQFRAESLELKTKKEDPDLPEESAEQELEKIEKRQPAEQAVQAPKPIRSEPSAAPVPISPLESELHRVKADFAALAKRVEALESRGTARVTREDGFFRSRGLPR